MAMGLKNFKNHVYKNVLIKTNHSRKVLDKTTSYEKHTASVSASLLKVKENNSSKELKKKTIHLSSLKSYPSPPSLPLPDNMIQIFGNETSRFTQERSRDMNFPILYYQRSSKFTSSMNNNSSSAISSLQFIVNDFNDSRTESYDCTGAVSLNSSMQSNVPEPFSSEGKSTHLNMPGGQLARDDKYIAEDMQNTHYSRVVDDDDDNNNNNNNNDNNDNDNKNNNNNNRRSTIYVDYKKDGGECNVDIINGWWFDNKRNNYFNNNFYKNYYRNKIFKNDNFMRYTTKADDFDAKSNKTTSSSSSSSSNKESNDDSKIEKLSSAKKLKRAVKDYGSTVIVFHVGLSLTSLGISYLVISSGIDVPNLINSLGFFDDEKMQKILSNSSTFVIAYAVHKLFAPFRISLTLATTPFLVRYLRKIGILKIK